MSGLPDHVAARRARQRAVRRRRQSAALLGVVVLAAALGALLIGSGGRGRARAQAAPVAGQAGSERDRARDRAGVGQAEIRRLIRLGLPIYCGGRRGHMVAFTFDDGPGPYTHYAVRKLTQSHERATFFVVGRSMDAFPGWLRRELPLAAIGDHTYTHPPLTALPPSQVTSEIGRTRRKIEAAIGQPVNLFRPPYGLHDLAVDRVVKGLGLLEILWNVDSRDSLGANYAQIISNVRAGLRPGAIILMHENRGQTIRALTTLLPLLHRRHLRSVTVPELLGSDPPSLSQVRRGPAGCGLGTAAVTTGH
jgi:peptidoglycan/xylan/chitin deacetylase (PgdA/CDA1 family)